MGEKLKILSHFFKSKALKEDIEEIKKMSNKDLIEVIVTHFKYGNEKKIVEPIFEDKYKGKKLSDVKTASMFFGILLQMGMKKGFPVSDYIYDLKELGFKETTIKELKPIFEENLKDFLEFFKEIEEPLLNKYCTFEWRIIKIHSNKKKKLKEKIRVEFKISVHFDATTKHENVIFEMKPSDFDKFSKEIDEIKKELKDVS